MQALGGRHNDKLGIDGNSGATGDTKDDGLAIPKGGVDITLRAHQFHRLAYVVRVRA